MDAIASVAINAVLSTVAILLRRQCDCRAVHTRQCLQATCNARRAPSLCCWRVLMHAVRNGTAPKVNCDSTSITPATKVTIATWQNSSQSRWAVCCSRVGAVSARPLSKPAYAHQAKSVVRLHLCNRVEDAIVEMRGCADNYSSENISVRWYRQIPNIGPAPTPAKRIIIKRGGCCIHRHRCHR